MSLSGPSLFKLADRKGFGMDGGGLEEHRVEELEVVRGAKTHQSYSQKAMKSPWGWKKQGCLFI